MPSPGPIVKSEIPWLWERARREPDKLALLCGDEALSFAQLAERAELAGARLAGLGVRPGDRVALLMDSSVRTVELIHAAQRIGAALVPLNTRLAPPEIEALIRAARPRVVIHDPVYRGWLKDAASGTACLVESESGFESLKPAALEKLAPIRPDAVHTIIFTSGTTGTPKGAMLTNANHFATASAARENVGAEPFDRWLDFLPLYHVGGLSIILRSVIDGATVILHRGFDPHRANLAIRTHAVTLFSVVATMLARMLDDNGDEPYPPSLRCVLVGGGPVAPALVERAIRLGVPVAPTYGLTETASQVATARPEEVRLRGASCGRPLPGVSIRIENPDAAGRGEVLVSAPSVMAGYFRDEDATRAAIREGWLHTGDIGHFDEEGCLHIDDRRSDLIVTGGENVYPAEVEAVLLAHPMVAEAGVYGLSDPLWGHRVEAAVVLRNAGSVGEAELRQWCSERLARFKVPKMIRFVGSLPRTASGKVRRGMLRREASGFKP
jgi:O-succinylbenzoic acid--CoA ligase